MRSSVREYVASEAFHYLGVSSWWAGGAGHCIETLTNIAKTWTKSSF